MSCIQVSRQLFTGPFARQMLHPKKEDEFQHKNEKWKVFVLLEKSKQGLVLKEGAEVLCQVHGEYRIVMHAIQNTCVINYSMAGSKLSKRTLFCTRG